MNQWEHEANVSNWCKARENVWPSRGWCLFSCDWLSWYNVAPQRTNGNVKQVLVTGASAGKIAWTNCSWFWLAYEWLSCLFVCLFVCFLFFFNYKMKSTKIEQLWIIVDTYLQTAFVYRARKAPNENQITCEVGYDREKSEVHCNAHRLRQLFHRKSFGWTRRQSFYSMLSWWAWNSDHSSLMVVIILFAPRTLQHSSVQFEY